MLSKDKICPARAKSGERGRGSVFDKQNTGKHQFSFLGQQELYEYCNRPRRNILEVSKKNYFAFNFFIIKFYQCLRNIELFICNVAR